VRGHGCCRRCGGLVPGCMEGRLSIAERLLLRNVLRAVMRWKDDAYRRPPMRQVCVCAGVHPHITKGGKTSYIGADSARSRFYDREAVLWSFLFFSLGVLEGACSSDVAFSYRLARVGKACSCGLYGSGGDSNVRSTYLICLRRSDTTSLSAWRGALECARAS